MTESESTAQVEYYAKYFRSPTLGRAPRPHKIYLPSKGDPLREAQAAPPDAYAFRYGFVVNFSVEIDGIGMVTACSQPQTLPGTYFIDAEMYATERAIRDNPNDSVLKNLVYPTLPPHVLMDRFGVWRVLSYGIDFCISSEG